MLNTIQEVFLIEQNLCANCFQPRAQASGPCPHCGYDSAADEGRWPSALHPGSIVNGKYILGRVLGQGGFGITYLAFDYTLRFRVAIKEYFPQTLATRMPGTTLVSPLSPTAQENFLYGAQRFLNEAQMLASLAGNPGVVNISSFFEENGTAYFVMEYVEGMSFQAYLRQHGGSIPWQDALRILFPVMQSLAVVHRQGLLHRDVTPDNIYLTPSGTKLLDFGAARYSVGDRSHSLDVILKAGYAPKEQYTRRGHQGPWTDIYSLAACFYAAITGFLPPESIDRVDRDELVSFRARGLPVPDAFEKAILKGLSVRAEDRFQSMDEFLAALSPLLPGQRATATPLPSQSLPPTPPTPPPQPAASQVPAQQRPVAAANTATRSNSKLIWVLAASAFLAFLLISIAVVSFLLPSLSRSVSTHLEQNHAQASDNGAADVDLRRSPAPTLSVPTNTPTATPQPVLQTVTVYAQYEDDAQIVASVLNGMGYTSETVIWDTDDFSGLCLTDQSGPAILIAFLIEESSYLDAASYKELDPDNWFETVVLVNADSTLLSSFGGFFELSTLSFHVEGQTLGDVTYSGYVDENGLPHGRGIGDYDDGRIYYGEWEDGLRSGIGIYEPGNGNQYFGEFANDKYEGHGIYIWADGDRFEGEYVDGERNGFGVYTWANGDRFEGEYVDGQRNGFGVYTWANGDRFEGEYVDGERNGQGTMYYADGTSKSGIWKGSTLVD